MVRLRSDPEEVARYLADRSNSIPAGRFPSSAPEMARPGLYSWWVDQEGQAALEKSLGYPLSDLIYVGQAGATSARSRKPSTATLGSRIGANHLNGTASGSTFRKTISALLLDPLGLTVEKPDRLARADRARVSDWMKRHLHVVVYAYDDRDRLGDLEHRVLAILDPPLNLMGMPPTPVRLRLKELRRRLGRPGATEPG